MLARRECLRVGVRLQVEQQIEERSLHRFDGGVSGSGETRLERSIDRDQHRQQRVAARHHLGPEDQWPVEFPPEAVREATSHGSAFEHHRDARSAIVEVPSLEAAAGRNQERLAMADAALRLIDRHGDFVVEDELHDEGRGRVAVNGHGVHRVMPPNAHADRTEADVPEFNRRIAPLDRPAMLALHRPDRLRERGHASATRRVGTGEQAVDIDRGLRHGLAGSDLASGENHRLHSDWRPGRYAHPTLRERDSPAPGPMPPFSGGEPGPRGSSPACPVLHLESP